MFCLTKKKIYKFNRGKVNGEINFFRLWGQSAIG